MNRCPLFVELCAGTVAVSLRLQGGNRCRPVVSRMGAKTGYANVILSCFGLTPGGKADAYLWCEPDPGARLLLQALPQPEVLREAASVLRGWASEDPRTLWEALRKEGAPKGVDGREVARHAVLWGCSFRQRGPEAGLDLDKMQGAPATATFGAIVPMREVMADRLDLMPSLPPTTITEDARTVDPREVARWVWVHGRSYNNKGPDAGFTPSVSSSGVPVWGALSADDFAAALDILPSLPPTTITEDARTVDPREVARIMQITASNELINIARSPDAQAWRNTGAGGTTFGGEIGYGGDRCPAKVDTLRAIDWPPVAITSDAREIDPPRLPEGTVVFCDPPYLATTGYGHDLPRSEVVRMARLWSDAGAFVGISEQEPIPELIADGWHAVEITHGRKGAVRSFSRQQSEFLTLNRPPVNPPLLGVQEDLW